MDPNEERADVTTTSALLLQGVFPSDKAHALEDPGERDDLVAGQLDLEVATFGSMPRQTLRGRRADARVEPRMALEAA